ncbi:hypothetical protein WA026_001952 [Henosepilachna vigintioctopunctata]|uniref:Uncharacterized protein n=1 Tax=Henosepilachna vigintioctopunctata TaxID=420089 RepID=A0AAW1UMP1_9CUCU
MKMTPCGSQNTDAITFPADCFVFPHFGAGSSCAVYSDDCRLDFGVKLWSHVSSFVTYRSKNSGLLSLVNFKHCSESSICRCFWSKVSLRQPLCIELSQTQIFENDMMYRFS